MEELGVFVPRDQPCPGGLNAEEVPFNQLSPTLQRFVQETGGPAPIKQCVSNIEELGQIQFIPKANQFSGVQFTMGVLTIPSLTNFVTKLAERGIIFPQMDLHVSRSILAGVTLVGHLAVGAISGRASSFLLGSFLGQIPSTLDALASVAVSAIERARVALPAAPSPEQKGISGQSMGQEDEEDELRRLREELEQLSGRGSGGRSNGAGSRRGVMVVN